jgi:hypothetical protein
MHPGFPCGFGNGKGWATSTDIVQARLLKVLPQPPEQSKKTPAALNIFGDLLLQFIHGREFVFVAEAVQKLEFQSGGW